MILVSSVAWPAHAAPPDATEITLEEAVQQVQSATDARILSADQVRSRHADMYRIKVLTNNGRVRVLEVDAKPDKVAESSADKARIKEKD